ncbi:MAG TPA: DeoR/GlpR transcriptional regulator [Rhizobiales bacterium]|nr:DeoR/GlpR transcriptional regulator [Hyphomicrobiales bacterium]
MRKKTGKSKIRQQKILEIIRQQGSVGVEELSRLLEVSYETIRRDLNDLARTAKIQKIHGGATLPRMFGEGPFQDRMQENAEAKVQIAKAAAPMFSSGTTLFIDTGSTTLYFAEALCDVPGLTVITNSSAIARVLSASKLKNRAFMLGGEFSPNNYQTVGTMVAAQARLFQAHHAVLTIGALDSKAGAMVFSIEEAQVAAAMIEQSQSLTILVDSSKFNKIASFKVCELHQINRLVTEKAPSGELGEALSSAGVEVIEAP